MKAYSYDETGEFIAETECQRDPVRSKREGRDCWLVPANATLTAPPAFDPDAQLARWDGTAWRIEDRPVTPEPEPPAPYEPPPRADELAAALVEVAAMVADNAAHMGEIDTALVELAELIG